jgi:hypothetical protein
MTGADGGLGSRRTATGVWPRGQSRTGRPAEILYAMSPFRLAMLVALLALALPTAAHATIQRDSINWAGYAASGNGAQFKRVAATWVQPAVTCLPGDPRYSAYWVGLGGLHTTAKALEQIGTEADCDSTGEASYTAWYELVPAGSVPVHLTVRPGDTMSASVTVASGVVKVYLNNRTRGTHFSKTLHATPLDVTSAEWIVEAPATCEPAGCHVLPLADFGTASFAGASATSMGGHIGTITDQNWSATALTLSPDVGGLVPTTSTAGATPGDLSAGGDGFTVSYNDGTTIPPPPAPAAPAPAPSTTTPPPAPTSPVPSSTGVPPLVGPLPSSLPGPVGGRRHQVTRAAR